MWLTATSRANRRGAPRRRGGSMRACCCKVVRRHTHFVGLRCQQTNTAGSFPCYDRFMGCRRIGEEWVPVARIYNKPPIIEAVCEFRFPSTQPWDITLPGRLYDQVKDQFPTVEPANVIQVVVDVAGAQIQQMQTAARILTQDRTEFIPVATHQPSIHHVPPYPS